MWIDVTWGAGGSTSDTTFDICHEALKYRGVDVMMHLTCSNMPVEKLTGALDKCKEAGIYHIGLSCAIRSKRSYRFMHPISDFG